jgi:RNA polymerase sigma-70 factor (sigma-E family)
VKSTPDVEFAEFMTARLPSLRRLALLLCQDWHRADDIVQAAFTRLYLHWGTAVSADSYVRTILVREFIRDRRAGWARRVSLTDSPPDETATVPDRDGLMDLEAAVRSLPPRQRAVLVLRYYCDLNVDQSAEMLGCSTGTVKSQTAKALASLRRTLGPYDDTLACPASPSHPSHGEVPGHA